MNPARDGTSDAHADPSVPVVGARVLLVGAHGQGRHHLQQLAARGRGGGAELVGVCDVRPLDEEARTLIGDAVVLDDLDTALRRVEPDVTVISTPIHTHVDLALQAARAGSHVLLEKPPAVTIEGYERLVGGFTSAERACQVNFQNNGSHALPAIEALVEAGVIGEVRGIGGAGAWVRDESYYARARWAGRRTVDGTPVVDGTLTNPFSHAVVVALRVAGAEERGQLVAVRPELFRANDIEADDTASVRIRTHGGIDIVISATLCAETPTEPYVRVHGTDGAITFWYAADAIQVDTPQQTWRRTYGRTDLLDDLLAHLRHGTPLLVPLSRTGAFVEVVDHVRTAADPTPIDPSYQRIDAAGAYARRVVPGVTQATVDSADQLATFSELGLPWAAPAESG